MNTDTLRLYLERFRGDEPTGEEQFVAYLARMLRTDSYDWVTLVAIAEDIAPHFNVSPRQADHFVRRAVYEWHSDPEKED